MRELRRVFIGALFFLASSYSFAMDVFDLSSQRENLFQVVKNNDEVNLTLLIQSGADLNIQDEEGRGLLYFAVANGHPRIVKILIANNIDIHLRDKKGRTVMQKYWCRDVQSFGEGLKSFFEKEGKEAIDKHMDHMKRVRECRDKLFRAEARAVMKGIKGEKELVDL